MHAVHLGFVAFEPFDVHRDGVDPAGHVLIGIGVHLLIDAVRELQIDEILSLVLKGGQLLLVLLDEPVELFLAEALPDVLIERLERRLVGPAELVVGIDERPLPGLPPVCLWNSCIPSHRLWCSSCTAT